MLRARIVRALTTMMMISCLFAGAAAAQSDRVPVNSRGQRSAEILRSHGIDLAKASLLAALKNADPQVRANTALQLASGLTLTQPLPSKRSFPLRKKWFNMQFQKKKIPQCDLVAEMI